ncbi:MAG: hypothetical protein H6737_30640 [Alphaproteobacteria bacterium]|nr:hypothetical protein [Alphaproteobacteria bacterium]
MPAAHAIDDAAFDRSLARQYNNATWSQLLFVYIGAPMLCVGAAFVPGGTLMIACTVLLVIAAGLASVTRVVRIPRAVRLAANPAELLVQLGAGAFPVLALGVPLAAYALWLLLLGSLASSGIL